MLKDLVACARDIFYVVIVVQDKSVLKDRIESIFRTSVKECTYIRPSVLSVEFTRMVDIGNVLLDSIRGGHRLYNQSLYNLSHDVPLVVFSNACIRRMGNSSISGNKAIDGYLGQDFFHCDLFDYDDPLDATFIYSKSNQKREAPTYFALPGAVRDALLHMSAFEPSISDDLRTILLKMADKDSLYDFSLVKKNKSAKKYIEGAFPGLTDLVFEHIPDEDKFAQYWTGDPVVTFHSNDGTKLLHGRGGSKKSYSNNLSVCDLSCDT